MKLMQHKDLKELIDFKGSPCISIYMQTAKKGQETKEGSIRLKNLIRESMKRLRDEEPRLPEQLNTEYEQAFRLMEDTEFWLEQNEGLAVFIGPSFFHYYRVGIRLQEQLNIGQHFYIKPMIPLFSYDRRYYLLALNLKEIRFFEILDENIFERRLEKVPRSIDEWMQYEDFDKQGQLRSLAPGKTEGVGAIFHGHGNMADKKNRKRITEQFLKQVVRTLEETLHDDPTRVILAADPYVHSVIKSSHPRFTLIQEPILENPSHLKPDELIERAQKVIRPYVQLQMKGLVRQFSDLLGSQKAAVEAWDVLTAAWLGKVQILLVDPQETLWGRYTPEDQRVELHSAPQPGDEDLAEAAVEQTLLHDGMIYSVPKRSMPDHRSMAALLRY